MNKANQISSQVFNERRKQLLSRCPADSIVLVPAAHLVKRSRDTDFTFRQDSYFYYLTGFNEPDAILVLSNNENQPGACIFVLPKDKLAEIWQGRRLGVDKAVDALQVEQALSLEEFDRVLPSLLNGHKQLFYSSDSDTKFDEQVRRAINACKSAPKNSMNPPRSIHDIDYILDEMRLLKSEQELEIMQHAADISVQAHKRAMQYANPNVWEYQLEAEILHEFAINGARSAAYNTIVGSGDNACILHYTENNQQVKDGDLVLIDAGCEYMGYAADITRTFPVNGKFSESQKQIYQLVLAAQMASIESVKPGVTFSEVLQSSVDIISRGLIELGILNGSLQKVLADEDWRTYFMHGIGHYLGLDVHDVGVYKENDKDVPLLPGTVITIEPGIYIPADADVDRKYAGIGVRIEDNIAVTSTGYINLTKQAPKTISDIESLMSNEP